MGTNAWTDKENAAIVALYFAMLDSAIAGEAYSKAAMIRKWQGVDADTAPLAARSKGSIEAKLMNCTAAHELLDPTAVSMNGYGYRPLTRFQSSLRDAMARAMQQRGDMTQGAQRRQALAVSKRA